MKKNKKAPKKVVAASKTKKAAPAKKPAKPVVKSKAKAPEKADKKANLKSAPAADKNKQIAKSAPTADKGKAVAKKEEPKKPVVAPKPAVTAKGKAEEKIVVGKKPAAPIKAGATSGTSKPAAPVAPIKVEPKIIEAPEPEFKARAADEQLFTNEELDMFRDLLETERNKILAKARRAMEEGNIQIDKNEMMDEVDQASAMVEQNLTFRLLDRDRKLLSEIDHALAKLESGDYGYCEGTGEPIPKRRLELRPWCRHSVKFKEKLERMKKSGRGVVDEDEV